MKARKKGNRNRLKCKEILERMGWLVDVVEKTHKFHKQADLFGLFDLVAIKAERVLFVQVKSNKPDTHKKFVEFASEHRTSSNLITSSRGIGVEQWVWKDRKGFDVYDYNPWYTKGYECIDEGVK